MSHYFSKNNQETKQTKDKVQETNKLKTKKISTVSMSLIKNIPKAEITLYENEYDQITYSTENIRIFSSDEIKNITLFRKGGQGNINKGYIFNSVVVLKFYSQMLIEERNKFESSKKQLEKMMNEIKALTILKHDSIPKLIGIYCKFDIKLAKTTKHKDKISLNNLINFDNYYNCAIVMEYIEGDLLEEIIENERAIVLNETHDDSFFEVETIIKQPPSIIDKLCWINQLVEIVFFLHKNHILHLDIKPSNIMIDKLGKLKLFDFGSCMFMNITGKIIMNIENYTSYTPSYILPEVLRLINSNPNERSELSNVKIYEMTETHMKADELDNYYNSIELSEKADVWNLSLTVSEFFSLCKPWSTNLSNSMDFMKITAMIMKKFKYQLPIKIVEEKYLDKALKDLIKKGTSYSPKLRCSISYFKEKIYNELKKMKLPFKKTALNSSILENSILFNLISREYNKNENLLKEIIDLDNDIIGLDEKFEEVNSSKSSSLNNSQTNQFSISSKFPKLNKEEKTLNNSIKTKKTCPESINKNNIKKLGSFEYLNDFNSVENKKVSFPNYKNSNSIFNLNCNSFNDKIDTSYKDKKYYLCVYDWKKDEIISIDLTSLANDKVSNYNSNNNSLKESLKSSMVSHKSSDSLEKNKKNTNFTYKNSFNQSFKSQVSMEINPVQYSNKKLKSDFKKVKVYDKISQKLFKYGGNLNLINTNNLFHNNILFLFGGKVSNIKIDNELNGLIKREFDSRYGEADLNENLFIENSTPSNICFKYKPDTNTLVKLFNLNYPRENCSGIVCNNNLFVVGGESLYIEKLEDYNDSDSSWKLLPFKLSNYLNNPLLFNFNDHTFYILDSNMQIRGENYNSLVGVLKYYLINEKKGNIIEKELTLNIKELFEFGLFSDENDLCCKFEFVCFYIKNLTIELFLKKFNSYTESFYKLILVESKKELNIVQQILNKTFTKCLFNFDLQINRGSKRFYEYDSKYYFFNYSNIKEKYLLTHFEKEE